MQRVGKNSKIPTVKILVGESTTGDTRITGKSRQMTLTNATVKEVFAVIEAAIQKQEVNRKK